MVSRLVLGCGSVGQRVIERLRTGSTLSPASTKRRQSDQLLVVSRDEAVVETLREESVKAIHADPAEAAVLEEHAAPDIVFVAGDSVAYNRAIVETVEAVFPDAIIVAYVGEWSDIDDGTGRVDDREAIVERATYAVDSVTVVVDWLLERSADPVALKAIELRRQLAAIDGRLAVVAHENPDPDALASAVALTELATAIGVEADACYYGEISHQENRAMVNLLDLELRRLEPGQSLAEYDAFALIDHSRPGVNDQLPSDLHIDIVIDHHPPRGPVQGTFVDLRDQIGATSTLLTGYLDHLGADIDRQTATALLYGIRVDTDDFTREVSSLDFEAAALLWPHVDFDRLCQISQPTVGGETLETIARAIKNRERRESVVVASVGRITDRDALPQAADQLLAMEGVNTTLVFGFREEMVYLSARSRGNDVDLGETMRDAYDQIGSAGGHADMAGAQLEMGILGEQDSEPERKSILSVVEEVITDRFFEAIESQAGTPVGLYRQTSEVLFAARESTGVGEE